jgi:hypothetical protein
MGPWSRTKRVSSSENELPSFVNKVRTSISDLVSCLKLVNGTPNLFVLLLSAVGNGPGSATAGREGLLASV